MTSARIRRVDDRLGLAVCRVGLSSRTLVTYARDHVVVRTPSRVTCADGNSIDLMEAPRAEDLAGWLDRFHGTIGATGARQVQLRWEVSYGGDATSDASRIDRALHRALGSSGIEVEASRVLLLDQPADGGPAAGAQIEPIPPPDAVASGAVDRRWHAATVLYRYNQGEGPEQWRDADQEDVAWIVDIQRELAIAGRCQVWVAMRHGGPAARLTVVHDRQGLAAIEDLVVHPVHRRRGLGSAIVSEALRMHLAVWPESRIGIRVVPGSPAESLARRTGFRPHATVWTARGAAESARSAVMVGR